MLWHSVKALKEESPKLRWSSIMKLEPVPASSVATLTPAARKLRALYSVAIMPGETVIGKSPASREPGAAAPPSAAVSSKGVPPSSCG